MVYRSPSPKAPPSCVPRDWPAVRFRSCALRIPSRALGRAVCASSKSTVVEGYPASCTTPVAAGLKVRTQSPKLLQLRRGVMELYISDHPLDCVSCPANGHCELQDMAEALDITRHTLRFEWQESPERANRYQQSILCLRPFPLHRVLALRSSVRRDSRHVCPDDSRARICLAGRGQPERAVHAVRVRFMRPMRRSLPDSRSQRKIGDQDRYLPSGP